jgi:hypothetical protein
MKSLSFLHSCFFAKQVPTGMIRYFKGNAESETKDADGNCKGNFIHDL